MNDREIRLVCVRSNVQQNTGLGSFWMTQEREPFEIGESGTFGALRRSSSRATKLALQKRLQTSKVFEMRNCREIIALAWTL